MQQVGDEFEELLFTESRASLLVSQDGPSDPIAVRVSMTEENALLRASQRSKSEKLMEKSYFIFGIFY